MCYQQELAVITTMQKMCLFVGVGFSICLIPNINNLIHITCIQQKILKSTDKLLQCPPKNMAFTCLGKMLYLPKLYWTLYYIIPTLQQQLCYVPTQGGCQSILLHHVSPFIHPLVPSVINFILESIAFSLRPDKPCCFGMAKACLWS